MYLAAKQSRKWLGNLAISSSGIFAISTVVVSGGNYLYNLILGNMLSPAQFSTVGLLVTLLLVFSFIAMTFQVVTTKFSVEFEGDDSRQFSSWMASFSFWLGIGFSVVLIGFSQVIAQYFQLSSGGTICIFAVCIPFFFLMSVKRGALQGKQQFIALSASYQSEMLARFVLTFGLLLLIHFKIEQLMSVAIAGSIMVGYLTTKSSVEVKLFSGTSFERAQVVRAFLLITAGYECAQVLINYCDVLMVRHYFDETNAGYYTSISLIGKMIYFVTWLLVMILLPKILHKRKNGQPYLKYLLQYSLFILLFSGGLTLVAALFPTFIVTSLFGHAYLPVADLLWKYALATMLFSLANLFVYYFLAISQRLPIYIAIFFGILQVILLDFFHASLTEVIWVQVFNMGALLCTILCLFVFSRNHHQG